MHVPVSGIKTLALMALFVILLSPGIGLALVPSEVVINKSLLLNLQQPSQRVSIANPAIAELIVISPTQLQINGKRIGSTTLIVWEKGGKTSFFDIRVKGDVSLLESQIKEIAPNDSVTVDYANDTILLSGKVAHARTAAKIFQVAQAYAGKSDRAAAEIEAPDAPLDNNQASYPNVTSSIDEKMAQLKGNDEPGLKVINQIQVEEPQQVMLEVKVAQVNKSALKDLGLSVFTRGASAEGFLNMVGAPSGELTIRNPDGTERSRATGIAGPVPGLASIQPLEPYQLGVSVFRAGVGAVLKALAKKDFAKILAEPNLLVRSGQVGKFLAGSKIPFSYISGVGALSTTSIQFIDVGVKVNFKPEVMENGIISLKIDPAEFSSITGTLAVNGYPIIGTREVRTKVQLKNGESLVLAGLLQEDSVKTVSKVPILGDIPILGALFRTTHNEKTEQELVFFITPRLITPNAPGTAAELPTDEVLTREQEKELRWMPLGD